MRLFFLILLILAQQASAKDFICKKTFIKTVKNSVVARASELSREHHSDTVNDKFMHCSVSCQLTFQCYGTHVLALGLGKEIWDVFTPGDADVRDLKADILGIDLNESGRARNNEECFTQCESYYPF